MSSDRIIPLVRSTPTPSPLPPIFERIGVVGLGLIGGSVALAARQLWPSSLIIGVDRHAVLERAMVLHAVDVAAADLTIVSEADLVVLAAPVQANLRILRELAHYIERPVVVTDVGSTKRGIVQAAGALPGHLTFVGGHPLAGSTGSGIDAARSDLFAGRPWFFTPLPGDDAAEDARRRLFAFVEALGGMPHAVSAEEHDRLVAFLSHLPQLVATALMQVVGDAVGAEGLALAGRGLRDTTRLAESPATIWTDICASNADRIGPAIDALIAVLQKARGELADSGPIAQLFEAANRWRSELPK